MRLLILFRILSRGEGGIHETIKTIPYTVCANLDVIDLFVVYKGVCSFKMKKWH